MLSQLEVQIDIDHNQDQHERVAVGEYEPEPIVCGHHETPARVEILRLLRLMILIAGYRNVIGGHIAIVLGAIDAAALVDRLIVVQGFAVKATHHDIGISIKNHSHAAQYEQEHGQNQDEKNGLWGDNRRLLPEQWLWLFYTYNHEERSRVEHYEAHVDEHEETEERLQPGEHLE